MRETIDKYGLSTPFVLLDKVKVESNIREMKGKADNFGLTLRPHFKTHQSARVGEIFRNFGVDKITVSSVSMAEYFANSGWDDILIAFPVNFPEMGKINTLATKVELSLLVDNSISATKLTELLVAPVDLYIKIDTGYNRAGVFHEDWEEIVRLVKILDSCENIKSISLLSHNGETYNLNDKNRILSSHKKAVDILSDLSKKLQDEFGKAFKVSNGDTPGCRLSNYFDGVDEIRPGNFVFYDWMMYRFGVCSREEIAIKLISPVVSVLTNPSRIILYAGAVHLSKDFVEFEGNREYGAVKLSGSFYPINRLSQEHGIVELPKELLCTVSPGDRVEIYPAHSCLTADLYSRYYTGDSEVFNSMEKHFAE